MPGTFSISRSRMRHLWDTLVAKDLQIWKNLELTNTSDSAEAYANAAKAFGMNEVFCREMEKNEDYWLVGSRPLSWWVSEVALSASFDVR